MYFFILLLFLSNMVLGSDVINRLEGNLERDLEIDKKNNKQSHVIIKDNELIFLEKKSDKETKSSTDFEEITKLEKELQAHFEKKSREKQPTIVDRESVKLELKKQKETQKSYDEKFKKITDLYSNRNHDKREAYNNQKNLMSSEEFQSLMKKRLKKNDPFIVDRIAVEEQLNSEEIIHGRVEIKSQQSEHFDQNNDIYEFFKFYCKEKITKEKLKIRKKFSEKESSLENQIEELKKTCTSELSEEMNKIISEATKELQGQLNKKERENEELKKEIEFSKIDDVENLRNDLTSARRMIVLSHELNGKLREKNRENLKKAEKQQENLKKEKEELGDTINKLVMQLKEDCKNCTKLKEQLEKNSDKGQLKEIEILNQKIEAADLKNANFQKTYKQFKNTFIFSNITLTLLYFTTFFIPIKNHQMLNYKDKIFLALFLLMNSANFGYYYKKISL